MNPYHKAIKKIYILSFSLLIICGIANAEPEIAAEAIQISENIENTGVARTENININSVYFDKILLGYYGRPGNHKMGIIGEHSPENLVPLLQKRAELYGESLGNKMSVMPTFHLVYGMAGTEEGKDGSYLYFLSHSIVMKYIELAEKENFAVILDIQLGNMDPILAAKRAFPYLKYKNVHLAIDPEFVVSNLKVQTRPGKVIGRVSAHQINKIQQAMVDYMEEHGIEENKILIVHSFRKSMITQPKELKIFDKIDLTINIDGYGLAQTKIAVFNLLVNDNIKNKAFIGFKLFLDPKKDIPLLGPSQSLGLKPHRVKVRHEEVEKNYKYQLIAKPNYINFQ